MRRPNCRRSAAVAFGAPTTSNVGPAAAVGSGERSKALARGTLDASALQALPGAGTARRTAHRHLAAPLLGFRREREDMIAQVYLCWRMGAFATCSARTARAEVPIVGRIVVSAG
jgi:hypothetical protein